MIELDFELENSDIENLLKYISIHHVDDGVRQKAKSSQRKRIRIVFLGG